MLEIATRETVVVVTKHKSIPLYSRRTINFVDAKKCSSNRLVVKSLSLWVSFTLWAARNYFLSKHIPLPSLGLLENLMERKFSYNKFYFQNFSF